MKIVISAIELVDRGKWLKACDLLGINIWAVKEGLMGGDDTLTLTEKQAKELELI